MSAAGPPDESFRRRAGLLVHITSLPGGFGSGDLGPATIEFLDWLAEAGLSVWQVLPVTPPTSGQSPYDGLSAFAGNPLFISPRRLVEAGWLDEHHLEDEPFWPAATLAFEQLVPRREALLRRAWNRFQRRATRADREALAAFTHHSDQREWLDDWVLFAALRGHHDGRSWMTWDPELRDRLPEALRRARHRLRRELGYHRWVQFVFFRQWHELRGAASARGITLLGDAPFYVAHDSADVWCNRENFRLHADGRPLAVAGVPPDYFSASGQLWGNPIYDWTKMAMDGFAWWLARLRANLRWADSVRLDHFRAFAAFWEVDAAAPNAVGGRWITGPGAELFEALRAALGDPLPLVAEDLGLIDDDVRQLRRRFGIPGMRVLQFGFDEEHAEHHFRRVPQHCVCYTGTHDNDTTVGWFAALAEPTRQRVLADLNCEPHSVAWALVEAAYRSPAQLVVIPLQDVLELGSEARMNLPGSVSGQWRWRVTTDALRLRQAERLRALAVGCGRMPAG